MIHGVNLPESFDLQGDYHRQKMMDAHRMAMAKVQSTVNSDRYAMKYHQNYATPKPVLSQRRFANPSLGNQADIYSARNVSFDCGSNVWNNYSGGLRGGVLFTQQAQNWGRQQLRNRINQLDAIDAEKQGMQYQAPESQDVETDNTKVKIEISQTLQAISALVESGQANTFAFNDTIKFLRLLFRWASTASLDELLEVLEYCEGIEQGLREILSQGEDNDANQGWKQATSQLGVLLDTFNQVSFYLKGMIKGVNKSFPERKRLSAVLVKSLRFTKLPTVNSTVEDTKRFKKEMRKRGNLPDDDDDDDDNSPYFAINPANTFEPPKNIYGVLNYSAQPKFDNQPREALANRNGQYIEDYDGNDGKEDADTFRRGDGEAQAQGLEVGLQEPNPFEEAQGEEKEERRARSKSRESQEDVSQDAEEPAASAAPAVPAPVRETEEQRERRYAEQAQSHPYTVNSLNGSSYQLVRMCEDLRRRRLISYTPRANSEERNIRKVLKRDYSRLFDPYYKNYKL
jgi:hypothetical protein